MASSLVGGLVSTGYPPENITVCDPDTSKLDNLKKQFPVLTSTDNKTAAAKKTIVLATKPQVLQDVCRDLAGDIKEDCLIISIAAGIRSIDIDRWLGNNRTIIRCMPNTPALLGAGISGLFANELCSADHRMQAESVLSSAGSVVWVNSEAELDAVTAVSGSGPAYFFLFMEAMQQAGLELGLNETTAHRLTVETALGAARMATEQSIDLTTLRTNVTSKGGTTEQAINSFEAAGLRKLVIDAMQAAHARSQQLADELGQDN